MLAVDREGCVESLRRARSCFELARAVALRSLEHLAHNRSFAVAVHGDHEMDLAEISLRKHLGTLFNSSMELTRATLDDVLDADDDDDGSSREDDDGWSGFSFFKKKISFKKNLFLSLSLD